MLGLVNLPNDISLSRANQSQAKFKKAVGGNLLQSWVNLTIPAEKSGETLTRSEGGEPFYLNPWSPDGSLMVQKMTITSPVPVF